MSRRRIITAALVSSAAVATAGCAGQGDVCADGVPEPGSVCTVIGSGERTFNGDGLGARDTALYLPSAVKTGPDGVLYVADSSNQRIRELAADGSVLTVAGTGLHEPATPDSPAIDSPLEHPIDFDFDADGRLVFASLHDPRIMAIDGDGMLRLVAGVGEYGDWGDGGPAEAAAFLEPTGIAVAADGTIYVADGLASRVRAIDPSGTVSAIAGDGEYGYAGDGGPALEARLDYPTALALDPAGRLLIADSVNHVVRRVEADGTIDTIAGTGDKGSDGDGGPARAARLNSPEGLAVDGDGVIYVSDTRGHRVRRIDPDGTIETVAGTGESGWDGDGGPATEARFHTPLRLSISGDRLYVADQNNARVRVIGL